MNEQLYIATLGKIKHCWTKGASYNVMYDCNISKIKGVSLTHMRNTKCFQKSGEIRPLVSADGITLKLILEVSMHILSTQSSNKDS